jgi:hypothetical protein
MAVTSSSSSLIENSSSQFYLSNGDHPGSLLVSQSLFGANYNTWSRSMIVSLIAKNKMTFIDGSLPQPHHLLQMRKCFMLGLNAIT